MLNEPRHWIIVAEAPFIPAQGGGELEHLGFVQVAHRAGIIAALVIPADRDPARVGRRDDISAIRRLVDPAPVLLTPRRRSVIAAIHPSVPYVVASRPVPKDLPRRLGGLIPAADAVLINSFKGYRLGMAIARCLELPAVLRQHNLEGDYHIALARGERGLRAWATRLEAFRIDRAEKRLERASWLAGIADISESDAIARARRSKVPVKHVPTFALAGRRLSDVAPWAPVEPPTAIFVGALDVATNHDALAWFATEVWPLVIRLVPIARLQVIGRRPTEFVREIVSVTPGAELQADVESLDPLLAKASVAVNPAVSGSGVNIKMVDYLASAVPTVSTHLGVKGLGLARGTGVLVEDEASSFAAAVASLMTDQPRAAALGQAGQRAAFKLLDAETNLRELVSLFRQSERGQS